MPSFFIAEGGVGTELYDDIHALVGYELGTMSGLEVLCEAAVYAEAEFCFLSWQASGLIRILFPFMHLGVLWTRATSRSSRAGFDLGAVRPMKRSARLGLRSAMRPEVDGLQSKVLDIAPGTRFHHSQTSPYFNTACRLLGGSSKA